MKDVEWPTNQRRLFKKDRETMKSKQSARLRGSTDIVMGETLEPVQPIVQRCCSSATHATNPGGAGAGAILHSTV